LNELEKAYTLIETGRNDIPERLLPTSSACKFQLLQAYYQVMEWIGRTDEMEPPEWGWRLEGE